MDFWHHIKLVEFFFVVVAHREVFIGEYRCVMMMMMKKKKTTTAIA